MSNEQEQVMLSIRNYDDQLNRVEQIFDSARRIALNVDTAIDEIITEEWSFMTTDHGVIPLTVKNSLVG